MIKAFFILTMISGVTLARPQIIVKSHPFVSKSTHIMLSDIAELKGFKPKDIEGIEKIEIIAELKDKAVMSNEQITQILKKENSLVKAVNPIYQIPRRVEIERELGVSRSEIEKQILENLKSTCPSCEFQISDLKIPKIKNFDEFTPWEINFLGFSSFGAFALPLYVHFPDQTKTYWVTGVASALKSALVAKRNIMFDERIEKTDFEIKKMDISHIKDGIASEHEAIGKSLRRSIGVGRIILRNDLKKDLAIAQGQMAKVITGGETFQVTILAQAEQNAYLGDIVKLKNPDTKKVITGIVIDKGLVRVE